MSFLAQAKAMVRVQFTGLGPMVDTLRNLASTFEVRDDLRDILYKAAQPIKNEYKSQAKSHEATGNLAKSVGVKTVKYPSGNAVAIAGPKYTGSMGATPTGGSGNHSWLVEFGSHGARRPKNRGKRRTAINVHKSINGKMKLHAKNVDSEKFQKMAAGSYFLMSSWRNPSRQAGAGKGYSHDFLPDGGVFALAPGKTYGAMPALHLMKNTIQAKGGQAEAIIKDGLINAINKRLAAKVP